MTRTAPASEPSTGTSAAPAWGAGAPAGDRRRRPPNARAAWILAALGTLGGLVYLFGPEAATGPVFLTIAFASIAAAVVGVRRHLAPAHRRPWWALAGALGAFLGGVLLRLLVPGATDVPPGPAALVPDLLIVPGYLLMGFGFIDMLRRRRAAQDDPARVDAFLTGLGAALLTWAFLIAPVVGAQAAPTLPQLVAAFFPLVDVILLVTVVHLLLAGSFHQPPLWALVIGSTALFAGDLLFALREAGSVQGLPPRALDVLFLISFLSVGVGALHPAMRSLTRPQQVVIREFGVARTAGIAAVLVIPTIVAAMAPPTTAWNGMVRTGLAVLLTLAALVRIVRANNSRARAERAARRRATHDALTDLPNRELLAETVTEWCDSATDAGHEISLLFIDLDRFKMVNDHWGHQVGDELLCAVAGRLSSVVRAEDLVCRIGGDEFVVALASQSHTDLAEPLGEPLAEPLAERLLADFAQPFRLSVGDVVVTPSIGVATSPGAAEALELIRDADTAMYKAKASGRNGYAFFDSSLRDQVRDRMNLEQALRGALERDELSVHYQPIIDLATDELTGFEALMRWDHPRLGSVSPMDFIPVAEDTGLIMHSGAWLLERAATQLVRWSAARPDGAAPLHVSVNISVRQLRDGDLIGVVRRVLETTGLPASALWLEITESGVMEDLETSLATLQGLEALGVTLAIDDFGTGYSSLSYLSRLPVGIVKVDRSFIAGVGEDGPNEPIVRAVLAMAHAMGRRVVAEGVETVVQRDWIRALGCDLAQGWYYGAPRSARAQSDWLRRGALTGSVPVDHKASFPQH